MPAGRMYKYKKKKQQVVLVKPKRRPSSRLRSSRPFPKSKIVTMKYVERFVMQPSSVAADVYHFDAGSIFDPNSTGTGHQPLTHDTWATIYNHYVVLKANIKVEAITGSPSNAYDGVIPMGITLTDDTSNVTTLDTLEEQSGSVTGYCMPMNNKPLSLTKSYNPKTFLGIKDPSSSGRIRASFGANPSETAYFSIYASPIWTTAPSAVLCKATIYYTVLLTEPKEMVQS
ncbi:MAG: putative capsid protein [Circoviridae sp.]|nr:MAG: putative capsid protein [Circoviridae sp.]